MPLHAWSTAASLDARRLAQARLAAGSLGSWTEGKLVRHVAPRTFREVLLLEVRAALSGASTAAAKIWSVRLEPFDSDPGVRPSHRQYVAYAAAWEPIPDDGLPRYPEAAT